MTGTGWTHTGEMTQGFAPMMPEGLDEAKRLFVAFKKLPEPRRERLRLAMDRLNRALRRPLLVQAAIDLGIALEVLFLEDEERAEMTFRLRVRAARYVAAGPDERRRIYDLIGNLYTLRSKGAHRGQLPPLVSGRDSAAVLREVATLVARTIGRMISAEPPNWTELVLE